MTINDAMAKRNDEMKRKWSWIGVIYSLCDGDICKTEQVVSKPFTECLVWLSYQKEMNIK